MTDVARDILPLIIVRCEGLLALSRALFIRSDACRSVAGFFWFKLAYSTDVHQGIDKARRNRVFAAPGDVSIPPGVTCRWRDRAYTPL